MCEPGTFATSSGVPAATSRSPRSRMPPDQPYSEAVPARANDRGPRTIYEVLTAHPTDKKRGHQILFGVPDGQGEKYLPLLGLIMQDARIEWQ